MRRLWVHSRPLDSQPTATERLGRLLEPLAVVAAIAAVASSRVSTLSQPLLEAHGFRQTQTAWAGRVFHARGVDLLRPEVPVLGEPWTVPFEFPAFQAIGAAVMSWGVDPDQAMRATGLAFFVASAVLVFAVARELTRDALLAFCALGFFLLSPFALLWSRSSMIEYAAVALTLAWFYAALRYLRLGRRTWLLLGVPLGALAMAVKVTTAGPWVLPLAALFLWPHGRRDLTVRSRLFAAAALIIVPLVAGAAWTIWADHVKAATPFTSWLTSAELRSWNFGSLAQRADLANARLMTTRVSRLLIGPIPFLVLAVSAFAVRRRDPRTIAVMLTGPASIAVFYNLYVVHDYYLAAVTPAVALTLAVGLVSAVRLLFRNVGAEYLVVPSVLVVLAWGAWMDVYSWHYADQARREQALPPAAVEIASSTAPEDRVLVAGHDWDPSILYYSQRRGLMLYPPVIEREHVEAMPSLREYRFLWVGEDSDAGASWATVRPWFAPSGSRGVRLAGSPNELTHADVVATGRDSQIERRMRRGERLPSLNGSTPCDGKASLAVPPDEEAVWLAVRFSSEDAGLVVRLGNVPLPNVVGVGIRPPADGEAAPRLRCAGGGHMIVTAAARSAD